MVQVQVIQIIQVNIQVYVATGINFGLPLTIQTNLAVATKESNRLELVNIT